MPSRHFLNISRLISTVLLAVGLAACDTATQAPSTEASVAANETRVLTSHPVSVSGVSAGAYMAVQVQVALSDRVQGVAAVAGGPYHCALGSITQALGPCINGKDLDLAPMLAFTREAAASGKIAALENLAHTRVWVFHSPADTVISPEPGRALVNFYANFTPPGNIRYINDVQAAHGWPTRASGQDCLDMGGDFINACDYDTAGALLNHLIDGLAQPSSGDLNGTLNSIDLSAYFESGSDVARDGYVFVPRECVGGDSDCRLHIAFHGCRQGAEFIGDRFAANAGLNEWAAANRIVVLYPQVEKSLMNPQGCWDWWGYTGQDYDLAAGKQVAGVDALITSFAKGTLLVERSGAAN